MWLELAGLSLAWLAQLAWYAAVPARAAMLVPGTVVSKRRARGLRALASVGWILAALAWGSAHGAVLGGACALASAMAAASVQAILAPLWPRWVLGSAVAVALLGAIAAIRARHGA